MSAQPLVNSQPAAVTIFSTAQLQASAIVMDADSDEFILVSVYYIEQIYIFFVY